MKTFTVIFVIFCSTLPYTIAQDGLYDYLVAMRPESSTPGQTNRTFTVDYKNNVFLLDGKPFNYVSGSIHYTRIPQPYWRDRLRKLRQAGFNAVQTYIPWNDVVPQTGIFSNGMNDAVEFVKTAGEEGIFVLLRPGPYICAEWEAGGLPWWLTTETPNIQVRTSDPVFLEFVEEYYKVLLPSLKPYLYHNGGPILMVQIENEYGLTSMCDKKYMEYLRDLFHHYLGNETVLYTTDPVNGLKCGHVNGTLTTVDFGVLTDMKKPFEELRKYLPTGPLVNSEFYPGWFDLWSFPHQKVSAKDTATAFAQLLNNQSISVNLYMFHGGTNFGFTAGGKTDPFGGYRPVPTSYDYDAPLSEAGDTTEKYFALQKLLNSTSLRFYEPKQRVEGVDVVLAKKKAYGKVEVQYKSSLFDARYTLCTESLSFQDPKPMDAINQGYGFLLYERVVDFPLCDPVTLTIPAIHDRGYVLVDGSLVGVLDRSSRVTSLPISTLRVNSTLSILVENQGRVGFGPGTLDQKGILSKIYLSCGPKANATIPDWYHLPLPLNNTEFFLEYMDARPSLSEPTRPKVIPAFFEGQFTIDSMEEPADTFLRLDGFAKGVVIINNINIGRYWPNQGPQVTLYVPGVFLTNEKPNRILFLELEQAPKDCLGSGSAGDSCFLEFVDVPDIDGQTPFSGKTFNNDLTVLDRSWETKM